MVERILVTGASGFVGSRLMERLANQPGVLVLGAVRQSEPTLQAGLVAVGNIDGNTDWSKTLLGQQVVVHTAARAHIMDDMAADRLAEFRTVNAAATHNLARQAAEAGVKRFVFVSSIKVNGEHTPTGVSFTEQDKPSPEDPYGISKLEAEQSLQQVARETGMEVVIIRPPLVYGPGVKGNFAAMIRWVEKGLPLPLGAIHNKRSLVALDNLVDLILTCVDHPAAANQVFLAGDGKDLSTTELLRAVSQAAGRPSRLIPVPVSLLMAGAAILGKKAVAQRLIGSLQVDNSKARTLLGWEPPLTVEEGLKRCFDND